MEYGLILFLTGCVAVGVVSAVIRTWSIHSRLYSLEDRLSVLESVQQREVKIRASEARWSRNKSDEALVAQLAAQPATKSKGPWWTNPKLKTGAYVG